MIAHFDDWMVNRAIRYNGLIDLICRSCLLGNWMWKEPPDVMKNCVALSTAMGTVYCWNDCVYLLSAILSIWLCQVAGPQCVQWQTKPSQFHVSWFFTLWPNVWQVHTENSKNEPHNYTVQTYICASTHRHLRARLENTIWHYLDMLK